MIPPLDLLKESPARKTIDISVVEDMRLRIIDGFKKNKIEVSELSVIAGPSVVRFEFAPNEGCKIKQIRSCENTLDELLSEYGPIRIIVSGKDIFAVEVPRPDRHIVQLREVLESDDFQRSEAKLPIAVGISSENKPIVADLARMPHLLIAGMTGQGKSILLNNIILSLLYKKPPEDLKLVLIDIKMVDFSQYGQISRQYFIDFAGIGQKVITDMQTALAVLNAVCIEMDKRYELFKCAKCRSLEVYNRLIQDGKLSEQDGHHHLPYIVVCIDEFADLIMSIGRDAECAILRIAQKARKVGIHVIIATQRSSANVITGVIKAYFPERIALRVDQLNDYNTILVCPEADRLIGHGDMLYCSGSGSLARIQCCFADTYEIKKICDWVKTNFESSQPYQLSIPDFEPIESDKDPLFMDIARSLIEQTDYQFPYEDYKIIGDTTEIDKVIQTVGIININVADITSTLSIDALNYVTIGVGNNIIDAMEQSVDNLPVTTGLLEKMLFQILIPKNYKPDMSAIKSMTDFIGKYNKNIDVCWGLAFDESLIDNIKVILIASSK